MNKKLLVTGLALVLTACGTPKKSADATDGQGGTSQGQGNISDSDFKVWCDGKNPNSFRSSNNQFCLVPTQMSVGDGRATGRITIDASYHPGKYIVSRGTGGAVSLQLNRRDFGDVNYNSTGPDNESGELAFYVSQPSHSQADATVYECFSRATLAIVVCQRNIIPGN